MSNVTAQALASYNTNALPRYQNYHDLAVSSIFASRVLLGVKGV